MVLDNLYEFPKFRKLRLDDIKPYKEWIAPFGIESSDLSFTNMFSWDRTEPVSVCRHGDFLCIVCFNSAGGVKFFSLLGDGDYIGAVGDVYSYVQGMSVSPLIITDAVYENKLGELRSSGYKIKEDRDSFDYVYKVSSLSELRGKKYDGKRNHIKKCLKSYSCGYEEINETNISQCLLLQEKWCNLRKCGAEPGLGAEFRAIRRSFEKFGELGLFGGAVRINDRIEAFAIAEELNRTTAIVHFEKANSEIYGLYQVINQWFCRNALSKYVWVNREQDMGIEGLRKAKMSYYPERFVKKYVISRA